jgi:hypothetical protein
LNNLGVCGKPSCCPLPSEPAMVEPSGGLVPEP